MRVSVLIPVFNTARFLGEALRSISEQTFDDLEILVIDDGSTDASASVIESHAKNEPRMRVIARENRGLIATRNELVANASGPLIAWMDSDDVSEKDRLEVQHKRLVSDSSLVCVGSSAQCIDPGGALLNMERFPPTHEQIIAAQLSGGGMRFPTTAMRRDAVLAVGGFREPFRMGEDLDLLLRLAEKGRLANIDVPLYRYRQHVSSVTVGLSTLWFEYLSQILELARQRRENGIDVLQAGGSIFIPPVDRSRSKRAVAGTYAYWASCALEHGERWRAIRYASRAVGVDPLGRRSWRSLLDSVGAGSKR